MHITLKESREMKYMGYTYKAQYKSPRGIPFTKYFIKKAEMDDFNKKAKEAGSTFLGAIAIKEGE